VKINISFTMIFIGLLIYGLLIGPFTQYMRNKPIEEKLGYVPSIRILKPMSADQKELVGVSLILKVMMYYGGQIGQVQKQATITESPDLQGMSRLLHGAVQLDPYNMDAYYFAQGFLTWDARQYKIANDLLEYGMKYRTWDWQLPYFAGFNNAFFLKDYKMAAEHYKKAGELSGYDLLIKLAGRYFAESGQTEMAISYLSGMVKTAKNNSIKQAYETRLKAFIEVRKIELARDTFIRSGAGGVLTIDTLMNSGYLNSAPIDPYGGKFYLESDGKVSTTSKFAFSAIK